MYKRQTHNDLKFTAPLTAITAAVVGVVLNLALFFGYHVPVSYTHLRAHETVLDLVCRLLLEKKKLLEH